MDDTSYAKMQVKKLLYRKEVLSPAHMGMDILQVLRELDEYVRLEFLLWVLKEVSYSMETTEFVSTWDGDWVETWLLTHDIHLHRHDAIQVSIDGIIRGIEEDISVKTGLKRFLKFIENGKENPVISALLFGLLLYASQVPFTVRWDVNSILVEDPLYDIEKRYEGKLRIMDHLAEITAEHEALLDVYFAKMSEEFACPQDWQRLLIHWAETRFSHGGMFPLFTWEDEEGDEES